MNPVRPRLVLVNGMPGVGKSTLAEVYRDRHPGVLGLDPDVLGTWIGGPDDHTEAARHLALALAAAHLATGHDVVVPQLVARADQLDRFASAAESAGADLVHVLLDGPVVEARVPDAALPHLVSYAHGLADLVSHPPRPHRVASRPGDVGATLAELEDLLGRDGPRLT